MKVGITAVRIVKGDTVFHVHGDKAGLEGVWLAAGQVQGIYDAPVQTTWKSGAFQHGSTQKHHKWLHRDLTLGFHIKETFTSYEFNESLFRQIFDYEVDPWDDNYQPTTIEVETGLSGVRKLDVLMYEAPDFDSELDPQSQQYGNLIMKLRAGQPFWYSDDVTTTYTGPNTSSGSGFITVSNPTDQTMYHKWVLTPAVWTLPDFAWSGPKGSRVPASNRTVPSVTVTSGNGGAVVDLDRQELMFRDLNNTNILGQLAGKFFEYPIPPYTPVTTLPVQFSGASGTPTAQLRQPRRWSRPWGMELASTAQDVYSGDSMTVFNTSGSFTYTIPAGANRVDVVLLGAGGGGGGGALVTGTGGSRGDWSAYTLIRGSTEIPSSVETIIGYVGVGGSAGEAGNNYNGLTGEATTASCGSWSGIAGGGSGSGHTNSVEGVGAGDFSFNGRLYRSGSSNTASPGQPGNPPGGGGAGGWPFGRGGAGGRGQAWFYAYEV